jgi:hypothetical protein
MKVWYRPSRPYFRCRYCLARTYDGGHGSPAAPCCGSDLCLKLRRIFPTHRWSPVWRRGPRPEQLVCHQSRDHDGCGDQQLVLHTLCAMAEFDRWARALPQPPPRGGRITT